MAESDRYEGQRVCATCGRWTHHATKCPYPIGRLPEHGRCEITGVFRNLHKYTQGATRRPHETCGLWVERGTNPIVPMRYPGDPELSEADKAEIRVRWAERNEQR